MNELMVHYPLLAEFINEQSLSSFVEVGVWRGHLSYYILNHCPCVQRSYAIDPYTHWNPKVYKDSANVKQDKFDKIYIEATRRLAEFGSRNFLLRMASVEAAAHLKKEQFDFVFIDANHDYEWVTKDLKAWYSMVRPGKIFGGHDYGHRRFPGVKKAIDKFCDRKGMEIKTMTGYVWYATKPV